MKIMVEISFIQFGSAVLIGLINVIFTISRTRRTGAKITFPQPFFIIVDSEKKITVKGLIHNIGDQNSMVQLDAPLTRVEGKKDLQGPTITAIDLNTNKPYFSQFPIATNQFYEIQATFKNDIDSKQNFFLQYRYVDKNGKWRTDIKEIQIGRDRKNLSL